MKTYFVDYQVPNGHWILGSVGSPEDSANLAAEELRKKHPGWLVEVNAVDLTPGDKRPRRPATPDEIRRFFEAAQHFDWFYQMADDQRSWRAGLEAEKRLKAEANGEPKLEAIWYAWGKHYYSGPPWKTPKAPAPKLEDYLTPCCGANYVNAISPTGWMCEKCGKTLKHPVEGSQWRSP